jgi:hypothetical protein
MKRLAAWLPTEISASAAILATFAVLNVVAPSVQAQTPNLPPRSGGTSYVGDEAQRGLGGQSSLPASLAPVNESPTAPRAPRADLPQLRTPAVADRPVLGQKAPVPSGSPVGSISPEAGAPHSFVIVTGAGIASADGIRVVWYPGDDAGQPASGAITATVRRRIPPDQVEIEIPAGAGGPRGGVVRLLARMPGQRMPVFVARFTVGTGAPAIKTARLVVNGLRPRAITTAPLQVSGSPPRYIVTEAVRVSGLRPRNIVTPALEVSGKR